jgi:small subunit ribosomal protein S4e
MVLNTKGKLIIIEISENEAKLKPCKIRGKSQLKGKIQLNLFDGRNVPIEKGDFKVGDTVLIEVPSQKIKDTIKLEKGNLIYLTGGKRVGDIGTVEDIKRNKIMFKIGNESVETSKEYAFAIGKEKTAVMIIKN